MTENLDLYNKTVSYTESDFTSGTFAIPNTSNWTTEANTAAHVHRATNSGYENQVYHDWGAAIHIANTTSITTAQQNTSICPKNWRLPINGDTNQDKSWAKLLNKYNVINGTDVLDSNHPSFALGIHQYYGVWNPRSGGSEHTQGTTSRFWSSTPGGTKVLTYSLDIGNTYSYPQYTHARSYGLSIRCVLR